MRTSEQSDGVIIRESQTSEGNQPSSGGRGRAHWWLGLAAILAVSVGYMLFFLDRGWIPHDEGTLAQSAERVLAGELPHRNLVEGYTGLLSYLNAFAFRVFGVHLLAIRYALFVAFIAWVLIYYHVAARIMSVLGASAVTLIAVFWSVPNYPAGMPSWYNLFLATAGLAALLQYSLSRKRKWLVVAGFAGGLSVLMKTPGLMFLGAGLLFLLYHESQASEETRDDRASGVVYRLAFGGILIAAVLSLLAIGFSRGDWVDVYQFTVPGCAMVALVGRRVFHAGGPSLTAARMIVRAVVPYSLGAAIPVAAFVAHYAAANALPDLVRDVVFLPSKALEGASYPPGVPLGLIPMAVVAFVAIDFKGAFLHIEILQHAIGIAVIVLTLVPKTAMLIEPFVWASLAGATPVVIPLLVIFAVGSEKRAGDASLRSRSVLLGCVAAFCSLVQYPFAAPIYMAYSLPLLLLAVVAVRQEMPFVRKGTLQGLTCFYLVFGALYITPMPLPGLVGPVVRDDTAILELPRAGLRVGRQDAEDYPQAVQLLRTHATSGVIYAGPDSPELYFLAEMKNPTPALFDFQVPDPFFHQHLLQRLDTLGVNAVALRARVVHSPPLDPEILDSLVRKFPFARKIGRFTIRWR